MRFPRRFVWWKILFWTVVGIGFAAGLAMYLPEQGVPAAATRIPAERFVTVLPLPISGEDFIRNVVVYPQHDLVQLITFDLHSPDGNVSAYTFADLPFCSATQLQKIIRSGRRMALFSPKDPSTVYGSRLKDAANNALENIKAQPNQQWGTVIAFLNDTAAHRAEFTYRVWSQPSWKRELPPILGGFIALILSAIFTRRSVSDQVAADMLKNAVSTAVIAPPAVSAVDLKKVEELDALLTANLQRDLTEEDTVIGQPISGEPEATVAPVPPVIRKLDGEALEVAPDAPQEQKDYAGEFYPTVRRGQNNGFSLVELLVSIGIIGILIAVLLPALLGARQSADAILCESHLRAIGQGMAMYLNQNQSTFPPAYLYIGHSIVDGVQTPTQPSAGYVHWSSYLFGSGTVPADAFTCPAMNKGGLPPTNTPPSNRDPGQECPSETVVDQQVPRLAYTVNEALFPRNKFVTKSFGSSRVYVFVKANMVPRSSATIMATEMIDNATAISYDDQGTAWIMSHRPISGYVGIAGELDMYYIPVGTKFRAATRADLDADPNTVGEDSTRTRLDLVGRNHGHRQGYPDKRLSNFLYVDGHVETKSVYDTVLPFQWGDRFYSLQPNDDQVGS